MLLFVMRGSRLVMLYALCVQALLEGVVKYWYVCRWMQGSAVKLKTYCIWWSVPAAVIAGGCLLHLQHSALAMLCLLYTSFLYREEYDGYNFASGMVKTVPLQKW